MPDPRLDAAAEEAAFLHFLGVLRPESAWKYWCRWVGMHPFEPPISKDPAMSTVGPLPATNGSYPVFRQIRDLPKHWWLNALVSSLPRTCPELERSDGPNPSNPDSRQFDLVSVLPTFRPSDPASLDSA